MNTLIPGETVRQIILDAAQILTGLAAIGALALGIRTNQKNTDSTKSQFWMDLRTQFSKQSRFAVHKAIRENHHILEWAEVDDYLGLFEVCYIMIRNGTLNPNDFRTLYGYRLASILSHDEICFYKLFLEVTHWHLLYDLFCLVFPRARIEIRRLQDLSQELVTRHQMQIELADQNHLRNILSAEEAATIRQQLLEIRLCTNS